VFSTDIWTVPEAKKADKATSLTLEKIKGMTSEQFLAIEESKLEDFLKSQGAPARFGRRKSASSSSPAKARLPRSSEMAERMAKARPTGLGASGSENTDLDPLRWSDSGLAGKVS